MRQPPAKQRCRDSLIHREGFQAVARKNMHMHVLLTCTYVYNMFVCICTNESFHTRGQIMCAYMYVYMYMYMCVYLVIFVCADRSICIYIDHRYSHR